MRIEFNLKIEPVKEVPLFCTAKYLKSVSSDYGWVQDEYFIAPFIRTSVFNIFTWITFVGRPYPLTANGDLELFLNKMIVEVKKHSIDWISHSYTHAIFDNYPLVSEAVQFGEYVLDISQDSDIILKNMHQKHRNVIKKATSLGCVTCQGIQYFSESYELIKKTKERQSLPYGNSSIFRNYNKNLLNSVEYYVALCDGEIQGCAVVLIDHFSKIAYYMSGGSIRRPVGGSLNKMQFDIFMDLKRQGINNYNFVGARVNPKKGSKLESIQRFKKRFGGELRQGYLWRSIYSKRKYKLFVILNKLRYKLQGRKYFGDVIDQEKIL